MADYPRDLKEAGPAPEGTGPERYTSRGPVAPLTRRQSPADPDRRTPAPLIHSLRSRTEEAGLNLSRRHRQVVDLHLIH